MNCRLAAVVATLWVLTLSLLAAQPHSANVNCFYWNERNGRFRDISLDAGAGITTPLNSHGVAAADFDNDGAVEILVNNKHDRPSLLKNLGDHGNWILLKLEGTKSNRDAIGAKVTVRVGDHRQMTIYVS